MGVALPHAGGRDLYEPRFRPQVLDRFGSAITHAGPQPADKLINEIGERSFEGDAAFDSFGHQLAGSPFAVGLAIAFARSFHHCTEAAHSAIGFERAALV